MSKMRKSNEINGYLNSIGYSKIDGDDTPITLNNKKAMSPALTHGLVVGSGLLSGYIAYRVMKGQPKALFGYFIGGVLVSYAFFMFLDLKAAKKI